MIIPHLKKQLKYCDYNNQDEDTIQNRSVYNNDNSSSQETAEILWL